VFYSNWISQRVTDAVTRSTDSIFPSLHRRGRRDRVWQRLKNKS
jgi:hypothetical protein